MKRLPVIFAIIMVTSGLFAQAPQKMSYQAVIRNSTNALVTSVTVGMRISILSGSATGTAVYVETQTPSTNANGLVSLEIGGGTAVTGTFASIDWSAGPYYVKTETDPAGGTNYNITGTSQLLSVPYALYSKTTSGFAETDPVFSAWDKSTGISIVASQVSNFLASINSGLTLTGQVTSVGSETTVINAAVISKLLTGFVATPGTVTAADNILQAVQKLSGNNPVHTIGENYGGGIVFYVYDNGQHGLIVSTADLSTSAPAGGGQMAYNNVRDGIGAGYSNTERLIAQLTPTVVYAATFCANYMGGNFGDWYLPSRYELNLLYLQRTAIGGFANSLYWSSTESSPGNAYTQSFANGTVAGTNTSTQHYVRAVRAF
jgi:hypothetical protein